MFYRDGSAAQDACSAACSPMISKHIESMTAAASARGKWQRHTQAAQ